MCLTPIRIRNRSRHYSSDGMQRRWLMVPCGHCAECIAAKRRQWYMRNYWHCKECYDKDGFVLFDSMTYDDAHLPHLSEFIPSLKGTDLDFPCFDKRDLDNFLTHLRTTLTRRGYQMANNFDYFYSTEYGSDDEYIDDRGRHRKATFRPHYHFLFYCRVPNLTPEVLAQQIYDSWAQGRTDCVNETDGLRRGYMYLHNVFSRKYGRKDDVSLRKVSNYVAKYVMKEPEYKAKVDARVREAFSSLLSTDMPTVAGLMEYLGCESVSELEKKYRDYIESYVRMFHNQSKGFGKYALDFKCIRDGIFNDGVVRIPDEHRIVADIPVPLYYVRKLYCHLSDALPGHYEWHWTRKGEKYLAKRAERSIKLAADKYHDAFLNMDADSQRFIIDNLGNGKPYLTNMEWYDTRFRALAEYELFRKDRFSPVTKPVTTATAVEGSSFRLCPGKFYAFIQDDDGALWRLCDNDTYCYVPPEEESRYLISDFCFDIVLDCFSSHFAPLNAEKQEVFDKKERLQRIFSRA